MAETASIRFLQWSSLYEEERPFQVFVNLLPDTQEQRKDNLLWDEKSVLVQDFHPHGHNFQLDTHGFTQQHFPGFVDLSDKEAIQKMYIPAVKSMLHEELENIRRSRSERTAGRLNFGDQTTPLLPSNYAHVDTSPISVFQMIRTGFPHLADQILRQRIRAVNVWKSLSHAVEEWALAVCNVTTVKPEDLVETDTIRQNSISTHYYAKYGEAQKWCFLDKQSPNEALIFKHFDSEPDVQAPYALHASMKHHHLTENTKVRRSIEVRTLVFSEKFQGIEDQI